MASDAPRRARRNDWDKQFARVARARLNELEKEEMAEPDLYVYKPATGATPVHINDFRPANDSNAYDYPLGRLEIL